MQNYPLYIRSIPTEDELKFHYMVHTSLDVVDEKISAMGKALVDQRELYLGLLYPTEDYKVYPLVLSTAPALAGPDVGGTQEKSNCKGFQLVRQAGALKLTMASSPHSPQLEESLEKQGRASWRMKGAIAGIWASLCSLEATDFESRVIVSRHCC